MGVLVNAYRWLSQFNSFMLAIGRQLAWLFLASMTVIILAQVVYRYGFNAALPWPEEAARALMIWMTALAAPTAYRYGSFVSLDMLQDFLSPTLRFILSLALLIIAGLVLIKLSDLALDFFQRGFRASTATIHLPWDPSEKLKRAWIYLAMPVCFISMLVVNVELLMREIGQYFGKPEDFPEPAKPRALTEQGV